MYVAINARNVIIFLLLAATGFGVYMKYFHGLSHKSNEELVTLYREGNVVAREELRRRKGAVPSEFFKRYATADNEKELRVLCASMLARTGDGTAVEILGTMLLDPDRDVRLRAIESLGATESPEAVPLLIAAFDDDGDKELDSAVGWALKEATGEKMIRGRVGWTEWWAVNRKYYENKTDR